MFGIPFSNRSLPTLTKKNAFENSGAYTDDERRCLQQLILWYRRRRKNLAELQRIQGHEKGILSQE